MFKVLRLGMLLVPCLCGVFGCAVFLEGQQSSANPIASAEKPPVLASAGLTAPVSPAHILSDALSLYRTGKLDAAIGKYELMLRANPASPEAHAGLARIYLRQGNVNLAAETVRRGLALSSSADLRVALGEIYFRQGKISEAEQEWRNVANSGLADGRAYLGLARVRNALSLYGQGKTMIDKAREIDPIDPDIELSWNMTLPILERIRRLSSYLNSADSAAASDREVSEQYLDYLEMLDRSPQGNCRPVKPVAKTETPLLRLNFDAEHLRGYGLSVKVNGRKATLMLDTGANGILINRKLAEKAGIAKVADSRIGGVGDGEKSDGYVGVANAIEVGDLQFENCPVRVLEKRSVLEDEGLIGADFFEQFLVNLDFPHEKLRLSGLPARPNENSITGSAANPVFSDAYIAEEMRSYIKVYRFGHYLLVPTKVGSIPAKLFLLDTGGLGSEITPAAAREVTKLHEDSERAVVGIGGSVKEVYTAEKAILEFGHLRQENQDLIAFDLSSASQSVGTEISGTLGFATLRPLNIKIDYRDGLVDFELNENQ